jgi:hypothetical protein
VVGARLHKAAKVWYAKKSAAHRVRAGKSSVRHNAKVSEYLGIIAVNVFGIIE